MRLSIACALVALAASPAFADSATCSCSATSSPAPAPTACPAQVMSPPIPLAPPSLAAPLAPPPYVMSTVALRAADEKNGTIGTVLAIGATVSSFLAFAVAVEENDPALGWPAIAAMIVAPSAGHIYAGEYAHTLVTTSVRAGGLLLAAASLTGDENEEGAAVGFIIAGGAALYDFVDAGRASDRHNREKSLVILPTVMPTHAEPAYGVSLGMSL
jgi:hypothetical protein